MASASNSENNTNKCSCCNNLGSSLSQSSSQVVTKEQLEKCGSENELQYTVNSNAPETEEDLKIRDNFQNNLRIGNTVACLQNNFQNNIEQTIIKRILNQENHYEGIDITHSTNIQLGNVTNIHGPVNINAVLTVVNQQSIANQIFVEVSPPTKHGELSIVYRKDWLALAPVKERTLLNGPAKFVIISHTVSEPQDNDQASNTLLVQAVQRFHMTKRNFDDIGYNFLIGSDGNVYEGRGWSVLGSFAAKYNRFSVGISFMGYFNEKLPTHEALRQAKILIQRGIKLGAIAEDYSLLGHCQCSETESPGDQLYLEIQTWDHWCNTIDTLHPSPLVKV